MPHSNYSSPCFSDFPSDGVCGYLPDGICAWTKALLPTNFRQMARKDTVLGTVCFGWVVVELYSDRRQPLPGGHLCLFSFHTWRQHLFEVSATETYVQDAMRTTHPSSPCSAGADPPSPCARRSLCSWLCPPRRRNPWAACASPARRSGCLQGGSNGRLERVVPRIWNTWNTWGGILGDRRAVAVAHLRGRPPALSRCRPSSRTHSRGSSARKLSTLRRFRTSCNSASALHTNRHEHHMYSPHSYSLRTAVVSEMKFCSQGWVVTRNLWT